MFTVHIFVIDWDASNDGNENVDDAPGNDISDAWTLGRSDAAARTRGRVRVRALGCYINPKGASS